MKDIKKNRVFITDQMVLIGLGFATIYWLIDLFLFIFMTSDTNLFERLFGSDIGGLSSRVIVLCLFLMFGSHAQYTINARKLAEKKMKADEITRERFRRLLSPDLAEMVVSGELKVEKGGVNRNATVLFVDIRNFTAMSEKMTAGETLKMLNEYFEVIVDVAFKHNGTVDKFVGDEMMVIWGAPAEEPNHSVRAVRAALEIQSALAEFNKKRIIEEKPQVQAGIGINTGNLVAGYIGSTRTMSYSVIGDTVNTASILCSSAQAGQIIISDFSFNQINTVFEAVELNPLHAKGKLKPIRVFNVLGNISAQMES